MPIAEYLKKYIDNLDEHYTWDFDTKKPKEFDINIDEDSSWLDKTRRLKAGLINLIKVRKRDDDLEPLAKYFIREWGKIRIGDESLKQIVKDHNNIIGRESFPENHNLPFAKISSWSKWLSLICPKWACIYDARVAYSLNAINYLSGGESKIFPMPEGRNSKLKMLDVSTLLISSKIRKGDSNEPKQLRKKYFIGNSEVYKNYLDTLDGARKKLWGDEGDIHDIEMMLFALADTFIYKDLFNHICDNNK